MRSPVFLSHRERKNARPSQRREVLVSKVGQTTTSHEVKSLTPNNHPKSVARQSRCHVNLRDVVMLSTGMMICH